MKGKRISMIRGTTVVLNLRVQKDNASYELKAGEILRFGVKKSIKGGSLIIEKEIDQSAYDPEKGTYQIVIEPEDTINFTPGGYFYDVGIQIGAVYLNVIEPSEFELKGNVTQRKETA